MSWLVKILNLRVRVGLLVGILGVGIYPGQFRGTKLWYFSAYGIDNDLGGSSKEGKGRRVGGRVGTGEVGNWVEMRKNEAAAAKWGGGGRGDINCWVVFACIAMYKKAGVYGIWNFALPGFLNSFLYL